MVEPSNSSRQGIVDSGKFAEIAPNPVSNTMRLKVYDKKSQAVKISLLDAAGRTILQRAFIPETNRHQEEFEVSDLGYGIYFLRVTAQHENVTLKVVKIE